MKTEGHLEIIFCVLKFKQSKLLCFSKLPRNVVYTCHEGREYIRDHFSCPGTVLNTGNIPISNNLPCLFKFIMLNFTHLP